MTGRTGKPVSQHTTPLNVVVYVINKKSQNHYAEELVKIIGAEKKRRARGPAGTGAVTEWLTGKLDVPSNEFHQADGSGMSRDNRASANAFIHLLRYMWKSPYREDFVSSLPYSGDPDCEVRPSPARRAATRGRSTRRPATSSAWSACPATCTARSGKVYAFSFVFNRYHVGVYAVYQLQDTMLKEIITRG